MKSLGILQPAAIGDILICLPIAKHYSELGYEIHWPILQKYYSMFKDSVDYVNFIPVEQDILTIIFAAQKLNAIKLDLLIPLGIGLLGNEQLTYTWQSLKTIRFDEFKYILAQVPFEKKFNLEIKRDFDREQKLYDQLVKSDKYIVVQEQSSNKKITINTTETCQRIMINNQSDSILDWIKIFENAQHLYFIDSCMVNLCAGLGIKTPGTRFRKPGYTLPNDIDYPVLTENWSTK